MNTIARCAAWLVRLLSYLPRIVKYFLTPEPPFDWHNLRHAGEYQSRVEFTIAFQRHEMQTCGDDCPWCRDEDELGIEFDPSGGVAK